MFGASFSREAVHFEAALLQLSCDGICTFPVAFSWRIDRGLPDEIGGKVDDLVSSRLDFPESCVFSIYQC